MVTLKTTFSDGDVFSSKTTSDPDGLNGITNAVNHSLNIYKNYVSAEEVTVSATGWEDTAKTFTMTHPANSVLLGFYLQGTIKTSHQGHPARARVKISGSTLGDVYLYQIPDTDDYGYPYTRGINWVSGNGVAANDCVLYLNYGNYVTEYRNIGPLYLNLPDTTTTFTIQLSSSHSTDKTAYLKDVIARAFICSAETL